MLASRIRQILATSILTVMASTAASAQGYMGISGGVATTSDLPSMVPIVESYIFATYGETCATPGVSCTSDIEDTVAAGKLFGGYRITPHFAVEGFLAQTSAFSTAAADGVSVTLDVEVDMFALGAAAVGFIPVSDGIELFGKAGGFYWSSDATASLVDFATPANNATATASETGTDFMAGLGAQFRITDTAMLRVEYEHYSGDDVVNVVSLGAVVGF